MAAVCKMQEDDLPILKGLLQHGVAPNYMNRLNTRINKPVRFGRVPKREKARIIAAMQSVTARNVERSVITEIEDETRVTTCVIQSYMDTSEFTQDRVGQLFDQARSLPVYTHHSQYQNCPMNPREVDQPGRVSPREFTENFSTSIRGVIEFSRRLPGFTYLPHEDQVTLLKSSAFEALLVRMAGLFSCQGDAVLCLNGRLMRREAVYSATNSKFLMDSMCEFADRLNRLGLSESELAMFSAVLVMSCDRPGIRCRDLVETMHNKYNTYLQNMLVRNHPNNPDLHRDLLAKIPDLRTLNTLHSDKLIKTRKVADQQAPNPNVQWDQSPTWDEKETSMGSPTSSCNTDEPMRSPGSYTDSMYGEYGSCEGSVCGSEVAGYMDARSTPLVGQRRRRDPSEGASSGDEMTDMSNKCPYSKRKVDSPEDSGIDSDKVSLSSICSSPRSSIDEKSEEDREEDMPVLRRALQAPPILNTDMRMEEAYKRHKKFRALRREEEPHSSQTAMPSQSNSILAQTLVQPISQISIQPSSSSSSHSGSSLLASALSSPSLAKSLSEQPKMSETALRKADMLHALMIKNESQRPREQLHQSPRVSPAPHYIPASCAERLQANGINWSTTSSPSHSSSGSMHQQSSSPQPRLHLLTTPTPSRYYEPRISTGSSPVGMGAQPSCSPSRSSPSFINSSMHRLHTHSGSHSPDSPVVELQVDIADSQPLNLSKKTPPPQEFMVEA